MENVTTPDAPTGPPAILAADDPPVFSRLRPDADPRAFLVADHGGRLFPRSLGHLGLPDPVLDRHVAYDIGIDHLTRRLVERLDLPAFLHHYSRLLIDPNRPLDDPTSICAVSDGVVVPGNCGITDREREQRAAAFFHPYHEAIDAAVDACVRRGQAPAVISLHSFTPRFRGTERPWHVGVLWADDDRMSRPLIDRLSADPTLVIGDNEPYSAQNRYGYTLETHAMARDLPNVLIEVRQDLIATDDTAEAWADRLADVLAGILEDLGLGAR